LTWSYIHERGGSDFTSGCTVYCNVQITSGSPVALCLKQRVRGHENGNDRALPSVAEFKENLKIYNPKVRHHRCVYNKLDWSVYTCLTQLYGGIDMYNLLHKEQLHVSALFICHLQVDK